MDPSFMVIMILLHFNPVNILLKYTIIKLQSFTEIIVAVKSYINDLTKERPPSRSELIIKHLTDITDDNIITSLKTRDLKVLMNTLRKKIRKLKNPSFENIKTDPDKLRFKSVKMKILIE